MLKSFNSLSLKHAPHTGDPWQCITRRRNTHGTRSKRRSTGLVRVENVIVKDLHFCIFMHYA
jgi:hypothetical protein